MHVSVECSTVFGQSEEVDENATGPVPGIQIHGSTLVWLIVRNIRVRMSLQLKVF